MDIIFYHASHNSQCCLERQLPDQNDITLYEKKLHEIFLSSWKETKVVVV